MTSPTTAQMSSGPSDGDPAVAGAEIHDDEPVRIYKFGARWICDGPAGRFHAKTKVEAERLLRETGGRYEVLSTEEPGDADG